MSANLKPVASTRFESGGLWYCAAEQANRLCGAAINRGDHEGTKPLLGSYEPRIAIVFSALAIEAWINELTHVCVKHRDAEPLVSQLAIVLDAIEGAQDSVVKRIVVASHLVAEWKGLDRGIQPVQDVALLVRIRNEIVHMRPGVRTGRPLEDEQSRQINLVRELARRRLCEMPTGGDPRSWLELISTAAVSQWSCKTVCRLVAEFRAHLLPRITLQRGKAAFEFIFLGFEEDYLFPPIPAR